MTAKGDWIQTMRGRAVDLLDPHPDDICPVELAILASRLNRFGGHSLAPYSVAEHSVRVAAICPDRLKLAGLLHDAHEAYWGIDFPRPWKRLLAFHTNVLAAVEHAWDEAIGKRFGVDPRHFHSEPVKQADDRLLATERRDLMSACEREWQPLPEPLPDRITPFREPAVRFYVRLCELAGESTTPEGFDMVRRGTLEKPRSFSGLVGAGECQHQTCHGAPRLGSVTA